MSGSSDDNTEVFEGGTLDICRRSQALLRHSRERLLTWELVTNTGEVVTHCD